MSESRFALIWALVAAIVLLFAVESFKKKTELGKKLGLSLVMAAGVILSYILSMISKVYFTMSVLSSISNICKVLMLYLMLQYTCVLTRLDNRKRELMWKIPILIWMVFDFAVLAYNPFQEFVMGYQRLTFSDVSWKLMPHQLYTQHQLLGYALLVLIFIYDIRKIFQVSAVYRSRYLNILLGVFMVALLNSILYFLHETDRYDISPLFYCAMGLMFYWNTFYYTENGMLNPIRQMLLEDLGHPLALFDMENLLVTCNEDMRTLLEINHAEAQELNLRGFIKRCKFEERITDPDQETSFQWMIPQEDHFISYRCDYRLLEDKKHRRIGRLFVFSDTSMEMDLLTGFHTYYSFVKEFKEKQTSLAEPACVLLCDLNKLSLINNVLGTETGDQAILRQSKTMREYLPEDTYFVRMNDASLLAVCHHITYEQCRDAVRKIMEELRGCLEFSLPLDIEYAISMSDETNHDIIAAAEMAYSSMRTKKMMNFRSAHSSLLDSLTQTLMESDEGTEAHVKRTCELGQELGDRLGLTDIEQSHLSLLCLLHDVGKVGIPAEILNKSGKLNDEEWVIMKSHTEKGYRIAKASPELEDIADLILHHHECWNGSGYPDGMMRGEIPLLSRIIAVVDAYDAMTNDRPYRKAMEERAAREELKRCAGTQFDPSIVQEFLEMLEEKYLLPGLDGERQEVAGEAVPDPDDGTKSRTSDVTAVVQGEETESTGVAAELLPRGTELADTTKAEAASKKWKSSMPVSMEAGQEGAQRAPGGVSSVNRIRYSKYVLDIDLKIIHIDPEFTRLSGYNEEDVTERNLYQMDLIFPEDREEYQAATEELLKKDGEAYLEHRLRCKDGQARYVFCYGRRYYDPISKGDHSVIMVTDVTGTSTLQQQVEAERNKARRNIRKLENDVRKDSLTGLLNHSAFTRTVEQAIRNKQQCMMLMLDVDDFKAYNDTYGHLQGDYLLTKLADVLAEAIGSTGVAGRLGGDEFAALIYLRQGTAAKDVNERVTGIWKKISVSLEDLERNVTITMGAVLAGEMEPGFHTLYQSADDALYEAKRRGKNNVVIKER